jgi:hypothetical protein
MRLSAGLPGQPRLLRNGLAKKSIEGFGYWKDVFIIHLYSVIQMARPDAALQ